MTAFGSRDAQDLVSEFHAIADELTRRIGVPAPTPLRLTRSRRGAVSGLVPLIHHQPSRQWWRMRWSRERREHAPEGRRIGEPRLRIRLRGPSLQLLGRGDELRDGQVCGTDERPQGPLGDLVVIRYG